jgi:hypothetical protein
VTMTDRCWPVLSVGIGSTVAPRWSQVVPVRCGRDQHGPISGLLVRPEGHGPAGRLQDRHGVDLGPRLRDAPTGPLAHEANRGAGRLRRGRGPAGGGAAAPLGRRRCTSSPPRLAQALGAHEPHPYHSCCRTPAVGACFRPPTTSCCFPGSRAYGAGVGSRGCADPRWSVTAWRGRIPGDRASSGGGERSVPAYRVHPAQAVAPWSSGSGSPRRGWSALARRSLSRRRGS